LDNNPKIETDVRLVLYQIDQRRDKEAMTASAKVKYKSIVRPLRRQQIENAALKAVLKHGFPGCTLRVVARETKVPLSFAHYYFRDKEDLMRRVAERILARAIERLEQARRSERDPLRAAYAVLQECLIGTTENRSALIAFVEHWAISVRKGRVDRFYTKVHFSFRQVIANALRGAGVEEPDRLALALFGMIVGYATFYWSKPLDAVERTSVLEAAYSMVKRAVRKGKGMVRAVPKTKQADRWRTKSNERERRTEVPPRPGPPQ
jgi:AcrR family transcriptional regulator